MAFQASSNAPPLLQLPREIRDQIYGYVFTEGAVHIHDFFEEETVITVEHNGHVTSTTVERLKARIYHHRCRRTIYDCDDEYIIKEGFDALDAGKCTRYDNNCHSKTCCRSQALCIQRLPPLRDPSLLLTCRLTSNEATEILYSNTAFCFDSWDVLNRFIALTPRSSLLSVRRICLQIPTGSDVYHRWWNETLLQVSTTMAGISHVYLGIVYQLPRMQKPGSVHSPLSEESGLTKGLMHLSRLPLKKATVLLYDKEMLEAETPRRLGIVDRNAETLKMKYSSNLQRRLLHQDKKFTEPDRCDANPKS